MSVPPVRWSRSFDAERTPRPRPLDADELIEFRMQQDACDYEAAEFAVALDSQAGLLDQDLWAELQAAGVVDAIANSAVSAQRAGTAFFLLR